MTIPNFESFILPILKLVNEKSQISLQDSIYNISQEFHLSNEEKTALLPSGKLTIVASRVSWARTFLKKAGLITSPRRGIVEITERGKKVLAENPARIGYKFLRQFPEFASFHASNTSIDFLPELQVSENTEQDEFSPEETLERAFSDLKASVSDDILEKIKCCSPKFFERLVVDTIVKMGYGGSRKEAGQAIGQSGDEGIDGIINEDRLGLDVIYLQAKRWKEIIGRPEVQKFAGALQGKRAKKGIFITTSDFTKEAKEYAKNIDSKITLISGRQLAEIMWEFNIGVSTSETYEIKKLDLDFFDEES